MISIDDEIIKAFKDVRGGKKRVEIEWEDEFDKIKILAYKVVEIIRIDISRKKKDS